MNQSTDSQPNPESLSGATAAPEPPERVLPNTTPVVAADPDTQNLLDEFGKKYGHLDLQKEAEAARLAVAHDQPMKASNMEERLAKIRAREGQGAQTPVAPSLTRRQPPAVPQVRMQAGAPQAPPAPAAAPVAAPTAAPSQPRIIDIVGHLNRLRARPPGWMLPPDEMAQRIMLTLVIQGATREGEDVLVPPQGIVTIEARVPKDVQFHIAELRKIQFHPFGLDRLLLGRISVDDVTIATQGPLTSLARENGTPTALIAKESVVQIRIRNVTGGLAPFSLVVVAVPLVPEQR